MITPRRLVTLAVVAVLVVAAAAWFASRRTAPHDTTAGALVLPGLEAKVDEVTGLRLTSKGASVTLSRKGNEWIVDERGYPADTAKLRKLMRGLAGLKVIEQKTRDAANYAQLGVEDAGPSAASVLVGITTPGKTFSLLVGHMEGGFGSYVRIPGEEQSVLASPQLTADADPKHWLDTMLVDLPADRVQTLEVTPATGPAWRATRDAAKDPLTLRGLPRGKTQRGPDVVTPVAALLVSLHAEDVHALGGAQAAPATAAPGKPRVIVRSFDGLEIELTGREDGDRRFIRGTARSAGEVTAGEAAALDTKLKGREFEIPRYKYDALFRALSDFT